MNRDLPALTARLEAVIDALALDIRDRSSPGADPAGFSWQADQAVGRWRLRSARDRHLNPARNDFERRLDEAMALQDELRALAAEAKLAEQAAAEALRGPPKPDLRRRDDQVLISIRDEQTGRLVELMLHRNLVRTLD